MPTIQGQLPGIATDQAYDFNISDNVDFVAAGAQYSQGGQLIYAIATAPTITQRLSVNSWGIQVRIAISSFPPVAGRLGKLLAALMYGSGNYITQIAPMVTGSPFTSIPNDALATLTPVWDGSSDPAPPNIGASGPPQILTVSQQLPQPVAIEPGAQIAIGLWLTPSLIIARVSGQFYLQILNGTYSIGYDTESLL